MKTCKKRWIVAGIIAGVVAVIFLVVVMCGKDYHSLDAEGLGKFIDQRENVWNQLIQEWEGESQDVWRYSPFKSAAERAVFSSSLLKRIRYDAQRNELTCYFSKTHHVTIWGEEELIYSPSHAIHDVGKTFAPYELNLTLAQEKEGFSAFFIGCSSSLEGSERVFMRAAWMLIKYHNTSSVVFSRQ